MNMKIYVACLASYNNGVLHGKWIDATDDPDEMSAEIAAMLRASPFPNVQVTCPGCDGEGYTDAVIDDRCGKCHGTGSVPSAEEYAFHDYDDMPRSFGEYSSLDEIAAYVELVEHIGDPFLAEALYDDSHDAEEAKTRYDDNYVGTYDSFQEYADEAAEDMLACHDLPDNLKYYFDYRAFERDLRIDMTVLELNNNKVGVFYA